MSRWGSSESGAAQTCDANCPARPPDSPPIRRPPVLLRGYSLRLSPQRPPRLVASRAHAISASERA
eukprot:3007815-Pyramimonas_sp.AAC.1